MRVLGVDLAWSSGRTGVCASEDDRVLDSALLQSDDDIVTWVERWRAPGVLIAFDAPLVVTNATGHRDCERVVSAVWRAEEAGCHAANTGIPWFADGGRAARLVRTLGLAPSEAIEVHPHAALVSLFGLPRTLKYKAGRGRDFGSRRRALGVLIARLQELATLTPSLDVRTSPRWTALVHEVARAPGGAALDRAEDELDAYVCAYIGRHHLRWRGTGRSVIVGDAEHGHIVTPVEAARLGRLRAVAAARGVTLA